MPARIPTGIEIDGHSGESTVGESVYGISPNTRNSPAENGPFALPNQPSAPAGTSQVSIDAPPFRMIFPAGDAAA